LHKAAGKAPGYWMSRTEAEQIAERMRLDNEVPVRAVPIISRMRGVLDSRRKGPDG
jgi:hypothetical protein